MVIYSADLGPQTIPIPATNLFDSYWWKEFGTCWHNSGYQVVATYTWYGQAQMITSLAPSALC